MLSHSDRRQTGLVLPNHELVSLLAELDGPDAHQRCWYEKRDLLDEEVQEHMMNIWLKFPMPDSWVDSWGLIPGLKIVFFNRRNITGRTQLHQELGSWIAGTNCGALLRVGAGSNCVDLQDDQACEFELRLVSPTNGSLLETLKVGVYLVRVLAGTDVRRGKPPET